MADPLTDLDPSDLILFARVVEDGSFTRAADRLGMPKSTASRRVLDLEARLGERLLVRTTRKLAVTEFGRAVLRHAQQVAAEVQAAVEFVQHRRAEPGGRLRISIPGDFGDRVLGPLLVGFVTKHPAVSIEAHVSQRRVDLVAEGYDLAIRIGDLPGDALLTASRVASLAMGLYASPDYLARRPAPAAPDDLTGHEGLRLTRRDGEAAPWTLTRGGQEWRGAPPSRISANSPGLLLDVALSGAGIARLAAHLVQPKLEAGELVHVLPDWTLAPVPVWVTFPGRRLMATRTQLFIDALKNALRRP